jgi:hypothetical protein
MPLTYSFDIHSETIHTIISGVVSSTDIMQYANELTLDTSVTEPFWEIIELKDDLEMTFHELKKDVLTYKYNKLKSFGLYVGTVVVASERVMQILSGDLHDIASGEKVLIIRKNSFQEAMVYIKQQRSIN